MKFENSQLLYNQCFKVHINVLNAYFVGAELKLQSRLAQTDAKDERERKIKGDVFT